MTTRLADDYDEIKRRYDELFPNGVAAASDGSQLIARLVEILARIDEAKKRTGLSGGWIDPAWGKEVGKLLNCSRGGVLLCYWNKDYKCVHSAKCFGSPTI